MGPAGQVAAGAGQAGRRAPTHLQRGGDVAHLLGHRQRRRGARVPGPRRLAHAALRGGEAGVGRRGDGGGARAQLLQQRAAHPLLQEGVYRAAVSDLGGGSFFREVRQVKEKPLCTEASSNWAVVLRTDCGARRLEDG